jgi:hypothetical protein
VNLRSRIGILPWHYLHRRLKCSLWLSCWFQIGGLDITLLNWPMRTSSLSCFEKNKYLKYA